MIDLEKYDSVVIDIDDTLIRGWFIDFMDLTWRMFKSKALARLLVILQYHLRLYRVNHRIADLAIKAQDSRKNVYFLTARSFSWETIKLIERIFPPDVWIMTECLGSYNISKDKYDWIKNHKLGRALLIDDNLLTRYYCEEVCDTIHPGDV